MHKILGLGLCLALGACVTPSVEEPAKCEGELRPANPYGTTLPSLPGTAAEAAPQAGELPANVDVFRSSPEATGEPAPGVNEQSDASGQVEVPRLSAAMRRPILSNC